MFGINKFWIWLAILGGTAYYGEFMATMIVWVVGIFYFFTILFFGGPQQFELKNGTWVKSISQVDGMTQVVLTDGEQESVQQFTSKRVEVSDNIISIY